MARGCGETGRRSRLKICFPSRECGFKSRRPHQLAALAGLGLFVSGCNRIDDQSPVTMSVIGVDRLALANPDRGPLDRGSALMLGATAQGLVSFDSEGQVEPALAERWIVTDDGRSFIFRIRRARWADGRPVAAPEVAARFRAAMTARSRNAARPMLAGVDQVVSMTGQVVEIRLKTAQPDFLQLLAQPDLAVFRTTPAQGTGPYRVHSIRDGVTRLRRVYAEGQVPDPELVEREDVRVRAEAAATAIARFAARDVALVIGGGFNELALARAARPATSQFQVDPAYGLFGLAVMADSTALADQAVRRALAMAIDRDRIVQIFGVNRWRPVLSLLPAQMDSVAPPAALEWVQLDMPSRRARALESIAGKDLPELRVALPAGPGARLLFAALADDWRRIGVSARAVSMKDRADLRLIDDISPQSSAVWYFSRIGCARGLVCVPKAETALQGVQAATTEDERASGIAEVDAEFASAQPYIPIALPLRWSLVAPQLTGWRPSAFAVHPLRRLRAAN
jgi:oligopeptide transport system substrate-binding protein